MSNNKIVQAMHLGATLRKERYEEILEDLYTEVSNRMNSNPEFMTKEISELLQFLGEMLQVVEEVLYED
tara:strand:- start:397 stop:603 length:207 start_codon:yes stop_codon:yes gene_type:complete